MNKINLRTSALAAALSVGLIILSGCSKPDQYRGATAEPGESTSFLFERPDDTKYIKVFFEDGATGEVSVCRAGGWLAARECHADGSQVSYSYYGGNLEGFCYIRKDGSTELLTTIVADERLRSTKHMRADGSVEVEGTYSFNGASDQTLYYEGGTIHAVIDCTRKGVPTHFLLKDKTGAIRLEEDEPLVTQHPQPGTRESQCTVYEAGVKKYLVRRTFVQEDEPPVIDSILQYYPNGEIKIAPPEAAQAVDVAIAEAASVRDMLLEYDYKHTPPGHPDYFRRAGAGARYVDSAAAARKYGIFSAQGMTKPQH